MARSVSAHRRLTALVAFFLPWLLHCALLEAAAEGTTPWFWSWPPVGGGDDPCLSWRVMVEANNAKGWRTVPAPCVGYVRGYMAWGQYYRDVGSVADQAAAYAAQISAPAADGLDAWVLDVDATCLSNQPYYQAKQLGACDPVAFKLWASRGVCPGIPAMQWLFQTLKGRGFRVFLVTGRDEETLGSSTAANLAAAGFSGYDRLIMRGTVAFKSAEGYRLRGNVVERPAGGLRRRPRLQSAHDYCRGCSCNYVGSSGFRLAESRVRLQIVHMQTKKLAASGTVWNRNWYVVVRSMGG